MPEHQVMNGNEVADSIAKEGSTNMVKQVIGLLFATGKANIKKLVD